MDETDKSFFVSRLFIENSNAISHDKNLQVSDIAISCFPNPFNSSVLLSYELFQDSFVKLDIYNVHGQKISTLINKFQTSGLHQIKWNGSNYPSGVYFYRLQAGNEAKIGKIMLLK